jgi:hypothetical protein
VSVGVRLKGGRWEEVDVRRCLEIAAELLIGPFWPTLANLTHLR